MKIWNKIKTELSDEVIAVVEGYLNMKVRGVVINVPYWRNKPEIQGFLGGKGCPDEIQLQAEKILDESDFKVVSPEKLRNLLKRKKIGVDCSGLAFCLLKTFNEVLNYPDFETQITPTGGKSENPKRFRTNADTLTSEVNSRVVGIGEIRAGDMIRMEGGRHVAVILGMIEQKIIYMHSAHGTVANGVSIGEILINEDNLVWQENLRNGKNLGSLYNEVDGDGCFRLNWWK